MSAPTPLRFRGFDELSGQLFNRDELATLLCQVLHELDGIAEAGCELQPMPSAPCGHCTSCSADRVISEIDAETMRRAWPR